jgi:hypothetical protein
MRKQLTESRAALTVLSELEWTPGNRQRGLISRHPGQPLTLANRIWQLLAVPLVEHGLVIKEVLL